MPGKLPHEGVYVRLGVSPREGVGVFAIRNIPEGTDLFGNDTVEMAWTPKAVLEAAHLSHEERLLYHAFGVARGDLVGTPVNFHNLTPGWYLNEPSEGETANVEVDGSLHFRAVRDIDHGEELLVDYDTFSEAGAGKD